jgi:hypothetical protein
MEKPNEKLNFEDITFDEVVGDGLEIAESEKTETTNEASTEKVEQPESEITTDSNELDADISSKKEDVPETETVKKTEPKETPEEGPEENLDTEGEDSDTVVGEVKDILGMETDNEFADTPKGIAELTQELGSQIAEEHLDNLMDTFPVIKQHLEYVLAGGDSKEFMAAHDPRNSYNDIELSENDTVMQKRVLANYFNAKGHDNNFINEMLQDYEDAGKLYDKSKVAKEQLSGMQQHYQQQMMKEQEAKAATTRQELEQYWDGIYTKIQDSDEISGVALPTREKKKFFDYISSAVSKEGYTQRDLDYMQASPDIKLAMDFLMYKGFDIESLVNTKAKTKNAKSLKARIKKNEEKVKSARKAPKRKSDFDVEDLDLTF